MKNTQTLLLIIAILALASVLLIQNNQGKRIKLIGEGLESMIAKTNYMKLMAKIDQPKNSFDRRPVGFDYPNKNES